MFISLYSICAYALLAYDVVYEYRWIEGQLNYNTSIRSTHDSFFGYSIGCTDTLCLIGAPVPGISIILWLIA